MSVVLCRIDTSPLAFRHHPKLTISVDEREEVTVVEKQLLMHLDMDPVVTINVLCDQIVSTEGSVDEDEQSVRDRLRSLVIDFMRGRAKQAIVRHAEKSESKPDLVLVDRVMSVRPLLSHNGYC